MLKNSHFVSSEKENFASLKIDFRLVCTAGKKNMAWELIFEKKTFSSFCYVLIALDGKCQTILKKNLDATEDLYSLSPKEA